MSPRPIDLARRGARYLQSLKRRARIRFHGKDKPIRLILGSGSTEMNGWLRSDLPELDITSETHWMRYFRPNSIENIMAEHVFEHLTRHEFLHALTLVRRYLRKDVGTLRIAVPDGYFPSWEYIEQVRPGGSGAGAHDHRELWNVESLSNLLTSLGYVVSPQEYFTRDGRFVDNGMSPAAGYISRSARNDARNDFDRGILRYTSLIVDATVPSQQSCQQ